MIICIEAHCKSCLGINKAKESEKIKEKSEIHSPSYYRRTHNRFNNIYEKKSYYRDSDYNRQNRFIPQENNENSNQNNNETSNQLEITPQMTIENIRYKMFKEVARWENKTSFEGGLDSYTIIKNPDWINQLEYIQAKSIKMFNSQLWSINQISWVCIAQK